jgi:DNA-binding NarL/FixJ family response regulator
VLVADDHSIVRAGIKVVINDILPFAEVQEACNGEEVMTKVRSADFDLIILDINMPNTDSFTLVANLVASREDCRILIFSMNSELLYAKRFLKLGALGYLHKESGDSEVKRAILNVIGGSIYVSQKVKDHGGDSDAENPFEKLSDREIQIAKCFLAGYSPKEIRKMLNLHSSTIGTHKTRLFGKLNIKNLYDLAELAKIHPLDGLT